jgi:muramidase (phage lysozyme)
MKPACAIFLLLACPALNGRAAAGAFDQLPGAYAASPAVPAASAPQAEGYTEAVQWLPPDNDEPGFKWPKRSKYDGDPYIFTSTATHIKSDLGALCALEPKTQYFLLSAPRFYGENIEVLLTEPPADCSFRGGTVAIADISSTSAGGLWELPLNVRAFLDTLAYAEGTKESYNYIFSFVTFDSYADHPRKTICSGKLCSTAAGRYQFLSKTWDALADKLDLRDFTPPNQEKATVELLRRTGAYKYLAKTSSYANFSAAVSCVNKTWASMPGSPYGQPTHPLSKLWKVYQASLTRHQ